LKATPVRLAATLLIAAVAHSACDGERYQPLRAGDPAPTFDATTIDGQPFRIGGAGQPALVNVWATWCIPCREEMPALQQLHETFGNAGLRVIGVNIGVGSDRPVLAFLDQVGVTYLNLRDPKDRITTTYRLVGVPETILIDASGHVAHRWIGRFDPVSDQALAIVRTVLADTGAAVPLATGAGTAITSDREPDQQPLHRSSPCVQRSVLSCSP
jgi:cytochrome c-type biogenesis protein